MPKHPDLEETPDLGFRVWTNPLRGAMPKAHRHSDIEANYIESGHLEYLFNGQLRRVPPKRLTFFWAAIPHQLIRAQNVGSPFWITLPLESFLQWRLPQPVTQSVLRGGLLAERDENPLTPLLLRRWCDDLAQNKPGLRDVAALEVEAAVRRLAACGLAATRRTATKKRRTTPDPTLTDKSIRHIVAMTRFMADHHRNPISTADIARDVGLHPNYAMNLFKWFCGVSLGVYLTRLRISHAQRLLATTTRSATQIAMDSGFGSVSRFYEAFAANVGQSPLKYRRAF